MTEMLKEIADDLGDDIDKWSTLMAIIEASAIAQQVTDKN
jgi:hypothetical protein